MIDINEFLEYNITSLKKGGFNYMFEEIRSAIAEQLNIPAENITMDSRFIEDLKADSLDLVELVMDLEDKYGVEIPDEQLAEVKTVGQIVEIVENNK